jgi:acetyl esterase/lipase
MRLGLLGCLALLFASPAMAAPLHPQDTGFLNRKVTLNGTTYRYDVYVPEQWSPTQKWPVILFLHGSGERGEDGLDQTSVGLPAAIRSHPDRWPFVVVMPQVPFHHHHWTDPDMMAMAMTAFDNEVKEFNGDPQRLYLTGLSLGGYGTWEIAKNNPGRFAAIVPVCGGIFWSYAPDRWHQQDQLVPQYIRAVGKTPVWLFHGEDDPVVSPRQSQIMYDALSAAGGNVRFSEYDDIRHNVWDKAYSDPQLPQWLLQHRLSDVATMHMAAEKSIIPLHPKPAQVDPAVYDSYEGKYYDAGVLQMIIYRQGDKLLSRNRTGDVSELVPESTTTFFFPSGGPTRVLFEKDSSGHVTDILYRDDRHDEHWTRQQ